MGGTIRLCTTLVVLMALSGCRYLYNPLQPSVTVNYYGSRMPASWLSAWKTVYCVPVVPNEPPPAEILCFDSEQEVWAVMQAQPRAP